MAFEATHSALYGIKGVPYIILGIVPRRSLIIVVTVSPPRLSMIVEIAKPCIRVYPPCKLIDKGKRSILRILPLTSLKELFYPRRTSYNYYFSASFLYQIASARQ